MPSPSAILLAAGQATRMGERPKCLLELEGKALILRQIEALQAAGVREIIVVTGFYAEAIEAVLNAFVQSPSQKRSPTSLQVAASSPSSDKNTLRIIRNPAPEAGQMSSLRVGLQALQTPVEDIIISLADLALVDAEDIQVLISAYENRPAPTEFTAPLVAGQPGNPVIFSQTVREEILQMQDNLGGKEWRAANPEKVYRWQTTNPHYRSDIDSPEDIEQLRQSTGLRLEWARLN